MGRRKTVMMAAHRLCVLLQAALVWTLSKAEGSTCLKDQANKCKSSAIDGTLDRLPNAGTCKPGAYMDYTHSCEVMNYLPEPDYCCCAFEQRVFCCRFHYIFNSFRCDESDDVIHEFTSETLALKILIPAIVVPSVALLCFIFYCIKCCCCNDDDDDDDGHCDLFSRCKRRKRKRKKNSTIRAEDPCRSSHDNQRSTLLPPLLKDSSISNSDKSSSNKCDAFMDTNYSLDPMPRNQPSAPPYEANGLCKPPPYNPELYDSVLISSHTHNGMLPYIQSQSDPGQGHKVIYQPIIAPAHIPLPVTHLNEHLQTTCSMSVEKDIGDVCKTDIGDVCKTDIGDVCKTVESDDR